VARTLSSNKLRGLLVKTLAASTMKLVVSETEILKNNLITNRVSLFLTGFVFGSSVAFGLGLNPIGAILFGSIAGMGVCITRSLISYLVIQTITFSLVAAISMVVFRTIPTFSLEPELFQLAYLALIAVSPLVFFVPRIKKALESFEVPSSVQLAASILFAGLVAFLRSRMPNDGVFALADMYFGEDNGGVIEVLAHSLREGFTPYSSHHGEFINGAYLAAAGNITWFGDMGELGLLPALTHYNMTLLFMAWLPIAALSAVVFSGKKFTPPITIAVVAVMTAVSALLFWPFVPLGHTSVISAGLFAMSLLAITLNRKLALDHPLLFISLITSLGLIVGNTWFPMMPFAAATVALAFLALLQVEYQKGNKKIVIALVSLFVALGLLLLPTVLDLALENTSYLAMEGGTRVPKSAFTVAWLTSLLIACLNILRRPSHKGLLGDRLFLAVVGVLTASAAYLLFAGLLSNTSSFGYGATKYLLTSIAFSTPIIWLVILDQVKRFKLRQVCVSGLLVLVVSFTLQVDSRSVIDTVIVPNSVELLKPPGLNDFAAAQSGVFSAIKTALSENPDQIFCVSDYGFPAVNEGVNFNSYLCSRWAGSLLGDSGTMSNWRFVTLDRAPILSLLSAKDSVRGDKIVVIRFTHGNTQDKQTLPIAETWWAEYVEESWKVIEVP
jgi:hypothetical protein